MNRIKKQGIGLQLEPATLRQAERLAKRFETRTRVAICRADILRSAIKIGLEQLEADDAREQP